MNTTINEIEPKDRIAINNKFSYKLSYRRKLNLKLADAVFEYLDKEGFKKLPKYHADFRNKPPKPTEEQILEIRNRVYSLDLENDFDHLLRYEKYKRKYGDSAKSFKQYTKDQYEKRVAKKRIALKNELKNSVLNKEYEWLTDTETGECHHDEYAELAKMAYTLRKYNKAMYAIFKDKETGTYAQQYLCSWYSQHRMDEVWNWRKAQIIRRIWREFMFETSIHEDYKPMHLVLTVPHTILGWRGKKFYGAELIEKFNFMRKRPEWKKYIYGGEYGLEVTRKGSNGLHIHLHCLVFQHKKYSVNEVKDWIKKQWYNLTEGEFIHYESLYVHKKDPKTGHYIRNKTGNKVKFYLDDSSDWYRSLKGEDKLKEYVNGVMECIKYHFKNDNFKDDEGNWDIELIKDILNHSKNLRFYSKFGAFYRDERLNFKQIEKEPESGEAYVDEDIWGEIERDDGEDENLKGSSKTAERYLVNPFTGKPALPREYIRVLASPEQIKHSNKDSNYMPIVSKYDHNHFFTIRGDLDIKEIMKNIGRGAFHEVLTAPDYERFLQRMILT